MATRPMSLREIRTELRKIPRDRRREIVRSIRDGRAVSDPRDAALAVACPEYLDQRRHSRAWIPWALPRERPHGKRKALWLAHAAWMLGAIALTCRYLWTWLPSPWRYLVIAFFAYSVATIPFTLGRILRGYWNAPQAAQANRELLDHTSTPT